MIGYTPKSCMNVGQRKESHNGYLPSRVAINWIILLQDRSLHHARYVIGLFLSFPTSTTRNSNSLSFKFSICDTVAMYFLSLIDWIESAHLRPYCSFTFLTTIPKQSFPLKWFELCLVGAANTYRLFWATPTSVLVFIRRSIACFTSGVRMIGTLLPCLPFT